MTTQVAQDLRAAANVLERDGWTQGQYKSKDGCLCMVGAVSVALGGVGGEATVPSVNGRRMEAARQLLSKQVGDGANCWFVVLDWNDEPGRTAEEVIAALRAAADRAEAEQ